MVWVKSFLAALKWTVVLFLVLGILFGFGGSGVSPAAFSFLGFIIMFILFLLENMELRY